MTNHTYTKRFGELLEQADKHQLDFDLLSPNRHQQALIVLGMALEIDDCRQYLRPIQLGHYIAKRGGGSKPPTLEVGLVSNEDQVRLLTDHMYMPTGAPRFKIQIFYRHGGSLLIWRGQSDSLEGGTVRLATESLLKHEFSHPRHGLYRHLLGGFGAAFDEAAEQAAFTSEGFHRTDLLRAQQTGLQADSLKLYAKRIFEMTQAVATSV